MAEGPLALIARLSRRGEDDLRRAAALARGEEIDADSEARLVRAGILRGRRNEGRARIAPSLLAPLLALDEALARSRYRVLVELHRLLHRSKSPGEREVVLQALDEELRTQRERLRQEQVSDPELVQILEEVRGSLARIGADDADPAQANRVAALCAEMIEMLARQLVPRRRRKASVQIEVKASRRQLAGAATGLVVALPRPLLLPSAESLADALRHAPAPVRSRRGPDDFELAPASRIPLVAEAAGAQDPAAALYEDQPLGEAFARHAALAELGHEFLARTGWRPGSGRREGPEPLAWSSKIIRHEGAVDVPEAPEVPEAAARGHNALEAA